MQNVYDLAHETARSLKETDQYKDFIRYQKQINSNPDLKKMIDDFQEKSMQLQLAQMQEGADSGELAGQVQSLYAIISQDPTAAGYFGAQMALSQIVADIYKIIGDAVQNVE